MFINQPNPIGDGGDQYTGLDRFGRVVDQYWTLAGSASDRFQYTYDQDSNRLTRTNVVNNNFNEQYGYDNLNQLTSFTRGAHAQSWGLDTLGNWSTFTNDGNSQTRGHNVQNQITSISGLTTPTYDNNGNTTLDQNNKSLVYDAWNRLVSYASTPAVSYGYDALNRRITSASAGTTTDLFYSSSWQVLEERVGGVTQAQYVWSPVYVDAMVERDVGTQRLYVQQDANWNVTAIVGKVGANWVVEERYAYDPYGKPSYYDQNWNSLVTSLFSWIYLRQGGRYDGSSGLYYFRNRDYSPALGRWMEEDPVGYASGDSNLYAYVRSRPTTRVDPTGTIDEPELLPPPAEEVPIPKPGKGCSGICFEFNQTKVKSCEFTKFEISQDCPPAVIAFLSSAEPCKIIEGQFTKPVKIDSCSKGCSCQNKKSYDGKPIFIPLDNQVFPVPGAEPKCTITVSGYLSLAVGKGWIGQCCPKK